MRQSLPSPVSWLGEEPLREVHPFSQFCHLLTHLLQLAHDLVALGRLHARPPMLAGDPLGDCRRNRSQHPERPAEKHEGRDSFRPVHRSDFLARSRSVKSMRSPRSPISRRACWISASRSSRRICSSSLNPAASTGRGRIRSARARTNGYSSTDDPTIVSTKRKTTSSGMSLPRRRMPRGFPLFRHQPLEEVHPLAQLTHRPSLVPAFGERTDAFVLAREHALREVEPLLDLPELMAKVFHLTPELLDLP